jgi:hypothetical protein
VETELRLTIEPPPRLSICAAAACIVQNRPCTPTENMRSAVSGSNSGERLKTSPDRIVDKHANGRGELGFDAREHRVDVLAPADVDRATARLKALRLEAGDGRLQPARADVHGGEPSALASEAFRDGEANSSRRAGHNADAILSGASPSARPLRSVGESLSLFAQQELLHLAGRRLGEIGDNLHMLRPILLDDLVLSQVDLHRFQVEAMSRPHNYEGASLFPKTRVGISDERR